MHTQSCEASRLWLFCPYSTVIKVFSDVPIRQKKGEMMSRVVPPKAIKGSQHWLQELVNRSPELLNESLKPRLGLSRNDTIAWLSPQESDDYAEYRDGDVQELLSIRLENRHLHTFWPSGGPQWDALGKTTRGDILLVEAKAHVGELKSTCKASSPSMTLIQKSLAEAGRSFGAASTNDWSQTYYQYANRLAYLYLLRQLNGIQAWLVFLYFVNANDVAGPKSEKEWRSAIEDVHAHLGINRDQLGPFVIDVFLDVTTPYIAQIDTQHLVQDALGLLQQYKVWVAENPPHGHLKLCSGFPTTVYAYDSEDALLLALRPLIKTS